jgi:hypothetical protein
VLGPDKISTVLQSVALYAGVITSTSTPDTVFELFGEVVRFSVVCNSESSFSEINAQQAANRHRVYAESHRQRRQQPTLQCCNPMIQVYRPSHVWLARYGEEAPMSPEQSLGVTSLCRTETIYTSEAFDNG